MQKWLLKNRQNITFITGLLVLIALMMQWFFKNKQLADLLLLLASLIGGFPILMQAISALKVKVISIDLLVTIAILGAFVIQEFEESAIVAFLFLFGAYLEQKTLTKTRSAIQNLVALTPSVALRQNEEGNFEEVDIDEVGKGDRLLVKTGDKIPVDGKVIYGHGSVNEASITGEPLAISKAINDDVFAGTILEDGTIQIEAEKVGEDSTFGKIIALVEEAQDSKSSMERFIDRFAKYYTPAIIVLSLLVFIFTQSISLAITILVLGCPGALVIGVPVSHVSGIGNGARHGILFKGSDVISKFSHVDSILFDKTGTLTYGNPEVITTHYYQQDHHLINRYLISIEKESSHPLAKAIVKYYQDVLTLPVSSTQVISGSGIQASVDAHDILIGNRYLLHQSHVNITDDVEQDLKTMEEDGQSIVIMAIDGQVALVLGIRDQLRTGVKEDLQALKKLGVKNLILLSGDNQTTVDLISKDLGLSKAYGNLMPEDKADFVRKYQDRGEIVAFVGDGINDSPSLASADIGIAMGNASDNLKAVADMISEHVDDEGFMKAFKKLQLI